MRARAWGRARERRPSCALFRRAPCRMGLACVAVDFGAEADDVLQRYEELLSHRVELELRDVELRWCARVGDGGRCGEYERRDCDFFSWYQRHCGVFICNLKVLTTTQMRSVTLLEMVHKCSYTARNGA